LVSKGVVATAVVIPKIDAHKLGKSGKSTMEIANNDNQDGKKSFITQSL
jgi:hypothetical protein